VETRLASARGAASIAQAQLQSSWAKLERLLGSRPVGLTDDAVDPLDFPASLPEAVEIAIQNSNELKASRYNEEIARAVARKAQAEDAPRVNLQVGVSGRSDTNFNGARDYDADWGEARHAPLERRSTTIACTGGFGGI
jgi:outer membrane protein TolC